MQMVSSSMAGLYQFLIHLRQNITDAEGWIATSEQMETSIPGVFAVGDVRQNIASNHNSCFGDEDKQVTWFITTWKKLKKKLAEIIEQTLVWLVLH